MVDLETRGAFVLSAIASSGLRSVELTQGGEDGLMLALTPAGDLTVRMPTSSGEKPSASGGQADILLVVEDLAIETERASTWLRRAGRFSRVPISIDGARIPHGFHGALIEQRLEVRSKAATTGVPPSTPTLQPAPALQAALAIARRGSTPRLWLLRHGIIATHATVPGYPAFEAALEMAPLESSELTSGSGSKAPRVTGATLREQLGPYLESLVDASVALMIELGKRVAPMAGSESAGRRIGMALPEGVRARVARLLLRSALKRRRVSEISGVRIFPLLSEVGTSLVSVDLISRLVRVEEGGTCALDAVSPDEDPKRYAVAGRGALAISQGERALLGELLSVVFSRPPARARQGWMRRIRERVSQHLPRSRGAHGAVLHSFELSSAERGLLAKVVAIEGFVTGAEFRAGRGKARLNEERKLVLPRDNAAVRAAVDAVESDAAWLYPATFALLGGRELPAPDMRRQWYARHDPS